MRETAPISNDAEIRRRVVKKVAWRITPFVAVLYFVNYLDRTNLAFAKLTMNTDLGLTEAAYGLASGIFFIGYLLLEVPSNLALHRFGARRWLARIMITWGAFATAMAFVPNEGTLYVLRFLLGVAEAGFFPGIILYLTFWFPKRERAKVLALFIAAIPLSTVIGGPVSAMLLEGGHGAFGLAGWRFMFLVEGIPAILLAFATWFYLTDRPAQAKWLDPVERRWLETTLEQEAEETSSKFHFSMKQALTSPRLIALGVVYTGIIYGLYALGFFLPTIVSNFQSQFGVKYSITEVGLITAVPYLVATVVMLVWARHADRTNERVWHVALPCFVGGIAVPLTSYMNSPFLAMAAVTLCAVGVLSSMPTFWYLPSAFLTGPQAAAGIAVVNMIGAGVGGFFGPYVTGFVSDATGSTNLALWIVGALLVLAGVITVALKATPRSEPAVTDPTPAPVAVTANDK
jgi:MFS family permease